MKNIPIGNKKAIKYTLLAFVTLVTIIMGMSAGFVAAVSRHEKVRNKADYDTKLSGWSQTSHAYFRREYHSPQAKLIGDMVTPNDRRIIRSLDEVSPHLIQAFIAGEDRYFYEHNGIVLYSIFRAAFQQVLGQKVTTGGSTITQQLVKNVILANSEKTFKRKTLEIINALRIERRYTKEEILLAYMNSVYFGKGVHHRHMYGVSSSSRGIFNKDVKALHLAEAAYLAGMVQRPNSFIPFGNNAKANLQRGIQRMKLILSQMKKFGFISHDEYETALHYDITKAVAKESSYITDYEKYPYIIHAVEKEAIEALRRINYKDKDGNQDYKNIVRNSGLRIYTTIDQDIYEKMQKAPTGMNIPRKKIHGKICQEQLGAVLIENRTGAILSFYSGTNFIENEKDHAFDTMNQPGSAMKPLLAYGPALNEGIISRDSIIVDEPLIKANSRDVYVNANRKYFGAQSIEYALQWSLNVPAVKVFRQLGIEHGFKYLNELELAPHPYDGEASVLGGMTTGYTVKQMTAAYACIANRGIYHRPFLIERITTAEGKEIYHHDGITKTKRIFHEDAAEELTEMLQTVVKKGTARYVGGQLNGYDVAGKTGSTTNDTDFWFVGYTPTISLGVWCGYDYKVSAIDLSRQAWVKFFKVIEKQHPDIVSSSIKFKK